MRNNHCPEIVLNVVYTVMVILDLMREIRWIILSDLIVSDGTDVFVVYTHTAIHTHTHTQAATKCMLLSQTCVSQPV